MTEHTCVNTLGGTRCDICFGPIPKPAVPELTQDQLLKLAREVAMDIKNLPEILAGSTITPEQYEVASANSFFLRALEAYRVEWNSALSTRERIRVQSGHALEQALPFLTAKMIKREESFDSQVKAAQLLGKLAGVEEQKQEHNLGEKFSITINLGADQKIQYEKNVAPTAPSTGPILQITEGKTIEAPIHPVDQKSVVATEVRPIPEGKGTD